VGGIYKEDSGKPIFEVWEESIKKILENCSLFLR
jgi:hypothetical protein